MLVGKDDWRAAPPSQAETRLGPRLIKTAIVAQVLALLACLFVALLCLMAIRAPLEHAQVAGWLGLVIFGGGGIVYAVVGLMANSDLRLDENGFSFATMLRGYNYDWRKVSAFSVIRVGRASSKRVVFSVPGRTSLLQDVNEALLGAGGALPDVYAMSPEKLAALMNAYRDQALRQAPRSWSEPWDDNAAPRATCGRKG